MGRRAYNHDVPVERQKAGDMYECMQLWAAVMQRAWDDLREDHRLMRESARAWFHSELTGVCSFRWICSVLDIDPDRVLCKVDAMPDQELSPEGTARIAAGARLRAWREESGIRQKQFADLLGLSQAHYSDYERGRYGIARILSKMTERGIAHNITIH